MNFGFINVIVLQSDHFMFRSHIYGRLQGVKYKNINIFLVLLEQSAVKISYSFGFVYKI